MKVILMRQKVDHVKAVDLTRSYEMAQKAGFGSEGPDKARDLKLTGVEVT